MFKTPEELKQFLTWAKEQGIQKVKVKDIEVEFTALAVIPHSVLSEIEQESLDPRVEAMREAASQVDEDDEDLFYSSSGA